MLFLQGFEQANSRAKGAILSQRNNWRLRETGPSIRLAAEGRQTALHFPLRQDRPRILGLALTLSYGTPAAATSSALLISGMDALLP